MSMKDGFDSLLEEFFREYQRTPWGLPPLGAPRPPPRDGFSEQVTAALRAVADVTGMTPKQCLSWAASTAKAVAECSAMGGSVVLEMPDGTQHRLKVPLPEWALTLGLRSVSGHTEADINAAFRRQAKAAHPDKETGSNEAMVRLNAAKAEGLAKVQEAKKP